MAVSLALPSTANFKNIITIPATALTITRENNPPPNIKQPVINTTTINL